MYFLDPGFLDRARLQPPHLMTVAAHESGLWINPTRSLPRGIWIESDLSIPSASAL